jgi:serine/threonine protein kinase/tetratricopeptide (TPR) repeat protein
VKANDSATDHSENQPTRPDTESYRPPGNGAGGRIGPYELLRQLGEGGFGIVYMAQQDQPVHRRVALKVIRPGMDSAQVLARFEAERQALALMEHQNIAKVYDAGTTDSGRPFFVMELVDGVPLTRYCDDRHLTVRERLALFVPVCKAVQHAHQKGIIHRDLKPSNVLVCLSDGQPAPKVIDFGVAKAVEQRLTERTMFTQCGQIIGTLEYMSPEQAEVSQPGVDTRSDIYSLGVMLYELLTGSTPLARQRLREAGLTGALKMIKEEEPPKPSTRLSGAPEAAKVASARRTEPAKLAKLLRGELDWVVMKCLEKDRSRRYDTALGLARDIERYLHDEPVEAGPPGAGYRLRRLARRHRTALGVAGIVMALLVLAAGVSTWQAVRATRAERRALAERDRAAASFEMARETVDRFFTQVGESPQLKARGMEKFRMDMLRNAKEFYERFVRERLDAAEVRRDLGMAHCRLSKIDRVLGDYAAARASSENAVEILGKLARAHAEAAEYQGDLAAAHFELGSVCFDCGRLDRGETAYLQALAIQTTLDPEVPTHRRALATTQSALGGLYFSAGRYEKARANLEQAVAVWSQLVECNARVPEDWHGLANARRALGDTYVESGRSADAEATLEKAARSYQALARDYPDVPEYRQSLAITYETMGGLYFNNARQADKAEAAYQKALPIHESLAREHPDVLVYVANLGQCYNGLAMTADLAGRSDAALTRFDQAVEVLERVVGRGYGEARRDLFNARIGRSAVLAGRGDHARATEEAAAAARQQGLSPSNLYNVGCVFGRSSAAAEKDAKLSPADRTRLRVLYADRAVEFLRRAVAGGYQNAPGMTSDPDLASLRAREDFRSLVREMARKGKN